MKLVSYFFQWFDVNPILCADGENCYPNCDGVVFYEIFGNYHMVDNEERIVYLQQLFSKGGLSSVDGKNTWSWDGNRENPSLNPSFLWADGRLHLFVRNGNLDILGDTTVEHNNVIRLKDNSPWKNDLRR